MITGYLRPLPDGRVFDYATVPFPGGAGDPKSGVLFNATAIESVVFEGYKDESLEKLGELLEHTRPLVIKAAEEAAERAAKTRLD